VIFKHGSQRFLFFLQMESSDIYYVSKLNSNIMSLCGILKKMMRFS